MKLPLIILVISFVLLSCSDRKNSIPTDNNLSDTTKVFVKWDTSSYTMMSCQAWSAEKHIDLSLFNERTGPEFNLGLENKADSWEILWLSQPSATDCLYVSSQFRILNQAISLNKEQFKSGEKLQGSVDLIMLGREAMLREPLVPFVDNRKWDTIKMTGFFSTRIN